MKKTSIIFLLLLSINYSYSHGRSIKTQAPFLIIPTDARGSGMGEVGAATSPDANSFYWNAAKYAFIKDKIGATVSFVPWLRNLGVTDVNMNAVNGFYRLDKKQVLAANFSYFGMGNIQYTNGDGTEIGGFSPNEFAVGLSYARKFTSYMSFSVNAKFIYSNLAGSINLDQAGDKETEPATAFAADVSGYFKSDFTIFDKKIENNYGFNISNLGSKISYTNNKEAAMPIPTNIRLGTIFKTSIDDFSDISIAIDIIKLMVPTSPLDHEDKTSYSVIEGMIRSFSDAPGGFSEEFDEITFSIGAEYTYANTFDLRLGYMMEDESKGARQYITIGLGLVYNAFNFDISYYKPTADLDSPLKNQLKFSLSFKFNSKDRINANNFSSF